jgi:hypothetical protein
MRLSVRGVPIKPAGSVRNLGAIFDCLMSTECDAHGAICPDCKAIHIHVYPSVRN